MRHMQKNAMHLNCPCETVGAKLGYVPDSSCTTIIWFLVGTYSSLIVYYEKYGENKHSRTRSSVFTHTKIPSVTIQENITAMRYRNDVIRSVLLLHIRAN